MKKILLVFLLLFSSKVKAITFYSDYSNFSDYTNEFVAKSDLVNVEEKINKKYYINRKVYSENGSYVDKENYEEVKSGLLTTKPEEKENRKIYTYDNSFYLNIPKVRYIYLDNSAGIRVKEIALYLNNKRYYYEFRCNDCFFGSYINIFKDDYFKIDLCGYYSVNDIYIIFLLEEKAMHFKIDINYINDITFYKNKIDFNTMKGDSVLNVSYYDGYLIKDALTRSEKSNEDQLYIKDIKYEYVDRVYKKYNLVKEYVENETNLYDLEKLYRYQTRDKIEINDNIVITDKKYNLKDYIKSTCDYDIRDNIDSSINGNYNIIINFKGKEIKRNVVVNIASNKIELDKEKELDDLKNAINKKEYEIKKVIEEKEKVNEEANALNSIVNNKRKTNVENISTSKGFSKRIIFIFLLIILLLILILIIKKKSN